MFIDTHTHIYTTEFDDDREEVISRAVQAGAQCLLLPNIDLDSISPMLNLYEQHPDLCRPMMGLHPTELPENPEPLLDYMERLLEQSKHPFVAIGEVGIDLYWDNSRCMEQIAVLRRQAEWALSVAPGYSQPFGSPRTGRHALALQPKNQRYFPLLWRYG